MPPTSVGGSEVKSTNPDLRKESGVFYGAPRAVGCAERSEAHHSQLTRRLMSTHFAVLLFESVGCDFSITE